MHALVLIVGDDADEEMAPFEEHEVAYTTTSGDTDWDTVGKWDYWTATPELLTLEGNWVSGCRRSEIDLEGMSREQHKRTSHPLWAPYALVVDGEWITWDHWEGTIEDRDGLRDEWCATWLKHLSGVPRDAYLTAADIHW